MPTTRTHSPGRTYRQMVVDRYPAADFGSEPSPEATALESSWLRACRYIGTHRAGPRSYGTLIVWRLDGGARVYQGVP